MIKQSNKEEDDPLVLEMLPFDDEWVANPTPPPPADDDEENETRLLDINDVVELEDNVGESWRRPNKRKRNGRNRASKKGYC